MFTFSSVLEIVKFNVISTAIFLPLHTILDLPKGRVRVSGNVNGAPFCLSVQFRRDGRRYLAIGPGLREAARIKAGDHVYVRFRVMELNEVELCDPLEMVVNNDEELSKIWSTIESGKPAILINYVKAVKAIDIRFRRAFEIIRRARATVFQPQQKKNRQK